VNVRIVVPDASVLLKWVMRAPDEKETPRALELKTAWLDGTVDLVVPMLWAFEVGNVLGLKQGAAAEGLLQAMFELALPEEHVAPYASRVFRLMAEYGVTFYDAAYHALAIHRDGVMLTADRRYLSRAGSAGHLTLLSDWRPPSGYSN
jgi:predicted nucleic acid-binding protein